MDFTGFLIFVVVGVVLGSLGGILVREGRYGLVPDLLLGVAGSGAASAAGWFSGIAGAGVPSVTVVAVIGAAATMACQRQFWPAAPLARARARVAPRH